MKFILYANGGKLNYSNWNAENDKLHLLGTEVTIQT